MRKAVFLSVALAAVVSACGRTPAEPENLTGIESTIQADNNAGDSAAERGGNLMGSGH
ncbi:MAG TPA: hypothetical protein VHG08_25870 [Longimicrobium sp.]|nr:hypothetical protein [Longimicrobium sp.]